MRQGSEMVEVGVEVILVPGLPQIQILGLPDEALRESVTRIRSAIRKQGFRIPRAQKILVQLHPSYQRKSSQGLDLAIAAAILWETEQTQLPVSMPFIYGELSLSGRVMAPDDVTQLGCEHVAHDQALLTGESQAPLRVSSVRVRELKDLARFHALSVTASDPVHFVRPQAKAKSFSAVAADVAMIVAAGEHSVLLAGPPGSGKSTLLESLPAWIDEPDFNTARVVQGWRPVVRPHHTITKIAMVGGGNRIFAGEIARAHTGVLLLDELLEFHPDIRESLREPMESGEIVISRAGETQAYPARFLLGASTNLCACGRFVPRNQSRALCRCRKSGRQRYLSRLSGPFADRFSMIVFSDDWDRERGLVSADEIFSRVRLATEFRKVQRSQRLANSGLSLEALEATVSAFWRPYVAGVLALGSQRRRQAVLSVARTLADLRQSPEIDGEDLDRAISVAWRGHRMLEEWQEF